MSGGRSAQPKWPVTDVYGIETYYCPVCKTPEPDGDIVRAVWGDEDTFCCEKCNQKYRAKLADWSGK